MYAIINIGSNLGNRRLNLSRAMAAVMNRFGNLEMSHTAPSARIRTARPKEDTPTGSST